MMFQFPDRVERPEHDVAHTCQLGGVTKPCWAQTGNQTHMGHPTHDLQSKTKQIPVDKCTPPPNPEKKKKNKLKQVGGGRIRDKQKEK